MFLKDVEKITKDNTFFRKVLHTGVNSQLVVMCIPVGEEIGEEVHNDTDQMLFIVDGKAGAILDEEDMRNINEHDVIFVPAGTLHNIKNIGEKDLKLFTVYAPAEHPDGTIHKTKADAIEGEKLYEK